ncbi:MAG: hypothetical protein JWQ09_4789 [Segetibacter sp.]|nr:hypothetical protein [Segetibacter sp.]
MLFLLVILLLKPGFSIKKHFYQFISDFNINWQIISAFVGGSKILSESFHLMLTALPSLKLFIVITVSIQALEKHLI